MSLGMRLALAALLTFIAVFPAQAETVCHPNDAASRILKSANPNDVAPDWLGKSYIGLDWSVTETGQITSPETRLAFLIGELRSPRGGDQGRVYVLAREWHCP